MLAALHQCANLLQDIQLNTAPLIVDLDGTLIHTDMLHESALRVSRDRPLDVLRIPLWLLQGKAVLKSRLASRSSFDASLLPYNESLLDWLKEEPGDGNARILTNAKCLSEGVDVPALDAVMFLNPRDSVVDKQCRTFEHPTHYISSRAPMPTLGTDNVTLTIAE